MKAKILALIIGLGMGLVFCSCEVFGYGLYTFCIGV